MYVKRPACFILTGCFNGQYTNCWVNDKINLTGIENDNLGMWHRKITIINVSIMLFTVH